MILEPKVEEYLYGLLPPRNAVLAEMEAQARQRNIPIVGPAVGRFFSLLARIHGARRVFELGSAIGYSTIWWAEAVGPEQGDHADWIRRMEWGVVRYSMKNLMSFPAVSERVDAGKLQIHGAYFGVATGLLFVLNPETDRFEAYEENPLNLK